MKNRKGHLFKRGNIWYVRVMVDKKPIVQSTGKTSRREAEVVREEIIHPFRVARKEQMLESVTARLNSVKGENKAIRDSQTSPLSIGDAWGAYIKSQRRPDTGPATLRQYELQWGVFVRWLNSKFPKIVLLCEVTTEHSEAFIEHLRQTLAPGTVNKYMVLLTLVFRILRDPGQVEQNPFENIPRLRSVQKSRRELTEDELRRVLANAEGDLRTLFMIGTYTGLRLGDAATLRWREVNLERDNPIIIRIPNKTARKSSKPVRIDIHRDLLLELRSLADILPEQRPEFVIPKVAEDYLHDSTLVTDKIQSHFRKCSIVTTRPPEGTRKNAIVEVGFHSLRHSFVSLCREANTPLSVVEAIVGHSNPAMTRHYTHVGEEASANAVRRFPSLMEHSTPINKNTEQSFDFATELSMLVKKVSSGSASKADKDRFKELAELLQ